MRLKVVSSIIIIKDRSTLILLIIDIISDRNEEKVLTLDYVRFLTR